MDTPDPHPATHATRATAPYVARSAEDVLAAVPVVLGFEPEHSVVMLTFGSSRPFHARVDLPRHPDDVPTVASTLVEPARRHVVERVVLVGYGGDGPWVGRVLRELAASFAAHGIEVLLCLRAHEGRWWPVTERASRDERGPGRPFDAGAHEFRARSVLDGRVTLPDRAAVAARVAPADGCPAGVLEALGRRPPPSVRDVDSLVVDLLASGGRPDDDQVAALLMAAAVGRCRDQIYRRLLRGTAAQHVTLWSEVVRRAPEPWAADAAAVLALAAWVSGDGALAWCAVERAQSLEPDHHLAALVAGLLARALPPEEWETLRGPLAG